MTKKENKREIVLKKKKTRLREKIIISACVVVIAAVLSVMIFGGNKNSAVSADGAILAGNEVMFSAALFGDGEAKFFEQEFPSGTVRYFLVQSNDGVVRAAFDACDVCFRSKLGYKQVGNIMVCNNCGRAFPNELINVEKGGCNPAPLVREVRGEHMVIKINDIEQGLRFF